MLSDSDFPFRRYSPQMLVSIGIVGILLFAATYFVEVRVVIIRPNYGDVTSIVQIGWRLAVGLATIGSFLLAARNYTSSTESPSGPATGFSIEGENHDIDFHLHIGENDSAEEVDRRQEVASEESASGETSTQTRDEEIVDRS